MSDLGNQPDDRQIGMNTRQSLVLLLLLFVTPVLIAWLMLYSGSSLIPEGSTSHGTLIEPPRMTGLPADIGTRNGPALPGEYLKGKWTLVYVGDAQCDEACVQNLYKMRQVRLAQNENMRRVQRLYLLTDTEIPPALAAILDNYPNMDLGLLSPEQAGAVARLFTVEGVPAAGAQRVFVVDPLGYLMMYYEADAEPKGMLKDLQKLLKYSRFG
jgi:cytochrome oxidase Cu insertion factor (SCO1/SenC/PrrC family)